LWWTFGRSTTNVWLVGERGTVLRWDGAQVTSESVPTSDTLFGVWGASDDDLWAVGGKPDVSGVILHRTASGWSGVSGLPPTGAYFKVWGASASDVYVCGQGGTVLHWDGAAWALQTTGLAPSVSLFTVAGSGASDVWAVGGVGMPAAIHFDGGGWKSVTDPAFANLSGLAGIAVAADGSVAMVGGDGAKLRGRVGALVDDTAAATRTDLHAVTFAAGGTLYAVGGNWLAPAPAARQGVIARFGN
jgi:hypothetical protein